MSNCLSIIFHSDGLEQHCLEVLEQLGILLTYLLDFLYFSLEGLGLQIGLGLFRVS